MKLKNEFIYHDTGSESILVPVGSADFAGVVRGNDTLGAILKLLQHETTEEEIVAAMCEKYDAPKELIAADVRKALDELLKIGAIEQ